MKTLEKGLHKAYSISSKKMVKKVFLGYKGKFAIFADPDSDAAKKHLQRMDEQFRQYNAPSRFKEIKRQILLTCAGGFAKWEPKQSILNEKGWAEQVYWDGEGYGIVWAIVKDNIPLFAIKMDKANYWDTFVEGRKAIKEALTKYAEKNGAKVISTYRSCGQVYIGK